MHFSILQGVVISFLMFSSSLLAVFIFGLRAERRGDGCSASGAFLVWMIATMMWLLGGWIVFRYFGSMTAVTTAMLVLLITLFIWMIVELKIDVRPRVKKISQ
ncbi:MAG: hypothetical protein WC022_00755 [Parcubacteria group bacterium]